MGRRPGAGVWRGESRPTGELVGGSSGCGGAPPPLTGERGGGPIPGYGGANPAPAWRRPVARGLADPRWRRFDPCPAWGRPLLRFTFDFVIRVSIPLTRELGRRSAGCCGAPPSPSWEGRGRGVPTPRGGGPPCGGICPVRHPRKGSASLPVTGMAAGTAAQLRAYGSTGELSPPLPRGSDIASVRLQRRHGVFPVPAWERPGGARPAARERSLHRSRMGMTHSTNSGFSRRLSPPFPRGSDRCPSETSRSIPVFRPTLPREAGRPVSRDDRCPVGFPSARPHEPGPAVPWPKRPSRWLPSAHLRCNGATVSAHAPSPHALSRTHLLPTHLPRAESSPTRAAASGGTPCTFRAASPPRARDPLRHASRRIAGPGTGLRAQSPPGPRKRVPTRARLR